MTSKEITELKIILKEKLESLKEEQTAELREAWAANMDTEELEGFYRGKISAYEEILEEIQFMNISYK
jgi:hypothetical protein